MNFCFIGDVHSQAFRLEKAVDFALSKNLQIVLLGDIFDSKIEYSDSTGVLNIVDKLVNSGHFFQTHSSYINMKITYLMNYYYCIIFLSYCILQYK